MEGDGGTDTINGDVPRATWDKSERSPLKTTSSKGRFSPTHRIHASGFNVFVGVLGVFTLIVTIVLIIDISRGVTQLVPHGAVVSDNQHCTDIGANVLKAGGTAADAAVAVQACLCVVAPHLTGIGGGGFALVHNHRDTTAKAINFRETVIPIKNTNQTQEPPSRAGVPGVIRGLYELHKLHGHLDWLQLLSPAIHLAQDGFMASQSLVDAVMANPPKHPSLNALFLPEGVPIAVGTRLKLPRLAETLKAVANQGPDSFYSGELSANFLSDVTALGGSITPQDLASYKAEVTDPLMQIVNGYTVITSPPPAAGIPLMFALGVIAIPHPVDAHTSDPHEEDEHESMFHSVVLALKGCAFNIIELVSIGLGVYDGSKKLHSVTDKNYRISAVKHLVNKYMADSEEELFKAPLVKVFDPQPSASVSITDNDELYVTMVTSLGTTFGSGIITSSGILLNSAASEPNPSDIVDPSNSTGKPYRPVSAAAPLILYDANEPCRLRAGFACADYQTAIQVVSPLLDASSRSVSIAEMVESSRLRIAAGGPSSSIVLEDHPQHQAEYYDLLLHLGDHLMHSKAKLSSAHAVARHTDHLVAHADSRSVSGGNVVF